MHVAAMTGNISALDRLLAAGAPRGCLDKVFLLNVNVYKSGIRCTDRVSRIALTFVASEFCSVSWKSSTTAVIV